MMATEITLENCSTVLDNLSDEAKDKCRQISEEFDSARCGMFHALMESLPGSAGTHLILPLFGISHKEIDGYVNTFFYDPDSTEYDGDVHLKVQKKQDFPYELTYLILDDYTDTDGSYIAILDEPIEFDRDLSLLLDGQIEQVSSEYKEIILGAHIQDEEDEDAYNNLSSFFFYLDLMTAVAGEGILSVVKDDMSDEDNEEED